MLTNLRNALMAGNRLPYDAEVEYLESTGTQYINTGLTVKSSLRILLDAQVDDICRVFGGRTASGSNQFDLFQYSTTNIRPSYGNRSVNIAGIGTGRHTFDFNQNIFSVDGVAKQTFTAQTFSSPSPICIGAVSTNDSGTVASSKLIGRIYSYKIWDNGTLVQDCIPVRKGTVGYLYDRASGKLFGNAGTGDFVVGQDVVPVEWLEAPDSGTYIMTGVTPAESSTVDFELNIGFAPASSGARYIIGDGKASKNHHSSITAADKFGAGSAVTATTLQAATMYNAKTSITSSDITFYITVGGAEESFKTTAYPSATYGEFMLFRRAYNALGTGGARMKSAVMNVNGITMRKFYAVRVGTDATSWEGAMMDVLTRRIYRNDGTGTFTYGNDLKYPIPAE